MRHAILAVLILSALSCGDGGEGDGEFQPRAMSDAPTTEASQPTAGSSATQPVPPEITIPLDERAVISGEVATLPISGGTLLLNPAGDLAIVGDPERDRISIVQVFFEALARTVALERGDQPTRMVMDDVGLVHVVLRGRDQIATIDPAMGTVLARREVCRAPRGIAHDAVRAVLHVTCASGELWTLPVAGGDATRKLSLGVGLRDVLVDGEKLWVSRFKSAELIELDAMGRVSSTRRPNITRSTRGLRATEVPMPRFAPNAAYRIALAEDGSIVMLHQRALVEPIKLDPTMPASANGYYGGNCGGIVESAVTAFRPDGTTSVSGALAGTLAVDLAVGGAGVALAFAGGRDAEAPRPTLRGVTPSNGASVMALTTVPVASSDEVTVGCDFVGPSLAEAQIVSIAQRPDGEVIVAQSREPAQLHILKKPGGSTAPIVELGGPPALDTGHELFHRSPDGGVTCASCHLEGGEDGHVWSFEPLGPRRTQAVNVGLTGTEPFHWEGDMPDLQTLLDEVLVVRMGGVYQSPERVEALSAFMSSLQPPPSSVSTDDAGALRGKTLFESMEVGCVECHAGAALTSSENKAVGKGKALQVPSLRGIEHRAPYLHDGCAPTLLERFDPACGGDQHGRTSQLSAVEIDDLIAYLRSL